MEQGEKIREKRRVAFYISSLRRGGAERVVVNLAEGFYRAGYDVDVVTPYRREEGTEFALCGGISRILSEPAAEALGKGRIADFLTRVRGLRRIWRERKPAVIVSFIGKNNLMALLSAGGLRIPVLVSVRGNPPDEYASFGLRLGMRLLYPHAAGVILQTARAKAWFCRAIRDKAVILPNPLHPDFLKTSLPAARRPEVVTVATLYPVKNISMALRAFAKVREEFPEWRFRIYGDGPERKELEALSKELGLSESVVFCGEHTRVFEAIREASVYVLTSNTEGCPNALIEAMSLGLACISTDCPCGGPAELLRDGENGFLIPVGDTEALSERLRLCMRDRALSERLGGEAAKIREYLAPDKVLRKWKDYVESKLL